MNGKKQTLIIEDVKYTDSRTGVESVSDRNFVLWADAGLKEKLLQIQGVAAVYTGQPYATQYHVYIDPRYDIEYIKREVEAVVICETE